MCLLEFVVVYLLALWKVKSGPELNPYLHELETHFVTKESL